MNVQKCALNAQSGAAIGYWLCHGACMNMNSPDLRATLLSRLRPFFSPGTKEGTHEFSGQLFSYCTLHQENLKEIVLTDPVLGIVLRGAKEVWYGGRTQLFTHGMVFAFPRGISLDVVNLPDERIGIYESLCLPIPELPPGIRPRAMSRNVARFDVALTPDLVEAIAHAATAVADPSQGEALARLRLTELLLLLDADPVGQILTSGDLVERARWLIAARPDHDWRVTGLAQELAVGASTLRRKLGAAGYPFRKLVADARMQAARQAIRGGADVSQAASVAGYQSRSHFTHAYRRSHGVTPGADRKQA